MPSKKKKYNARFPAGRIKKIMQTDEEVGKVAQAVPVIISRTLELFVESLLTKTMQITSAKNAKTLSPSHMKQCILSESRFDFLKDLVKGLPDATGPDDDVPTPPLTPAPTIIETQMIPATCPLPTQLKAGCARDVVPPMSSPPIGIRQSSKEPRGTGCSNSIISKDAIKVDIPVSHLQPLTTSFNVSQPNFYTEVNPINLSKDSSIHPSIRSASSYSNAVNIDEDYDT